MFNSFLIIPLRAAIPVMALQVTITAGEWVYVADESTVLELMRARAKLWLDYGQICHDDGNKCFPTRP